VTKKREKRLWGPTDTAWKGNHNRAEVLEHHKYRVTLSKVYGQEDSYII
jgi:hypothetical protein